MVSRVIERGGGRFPGLSVAAAVAPKPLRRKKRTKYTLVRTALFPCTHINFWDVAAERDVFVGFTVDRTRRGGRVRRR